MSTLKSCIKHLSSNLKHYSALYDKQDLDQATSTLKYLKQLEKMKEDKQ